MENEGENLSDSSVRSSEEKEIERMFYNFYIWSKKQPELVQLHVKCLEEYYFQ